MNPIARAALEAFELGGSSVLPRGTLEDALARNGALCRETCDGVLADLVRQGMLAPAADGSLVRRTEAGRLALRGPLDLTLYTRAGCHLCEEMKSALAPIAREFAARISEVDVDQSDELRALYGSDVPVLFLGSRKAAKHRLDERQMRRQLERASRKG
ncbi:MAG TPA: glutaredoxin family protein [Candidatus Acidoferrales bacterium]|nr:glutaredoxin family protein [Candidatus Acidoferrales bacterium]